MPSYANSIGDGSLLWSYESETYSHSWTVCVARWHNTSQGV